MKKCVKITLFNVRDLQSLYQALKKGVFMDEIEGVIESITPDNVEITVSGPKDIVDQFVNEVDGIVITYNLEQDQSVTFIVEPFLKNEDYRGIIRFLRKSSPNRA